MGYRYDRGKNMKPHEIEQKIIRTVRTLPPQGLREVAEKVGRNPNEERVAREAIRALVSRGVLEVDIDWKLRPSD
jgi:predicted transcriptional regulator